MTDAVAALLFQFTLLFPTSFILQNNDKKCPFTGMGCWLVAKKPLGRVMTDTPWRVYIYRTLNN
jgi:hypothetical protein